MPLASAFSAAARRVNRVQSAVSQSMHGLEVILGTPVFDRSGKAPKLNEAGRAILGDARRLVDAARALKAHAAEMAAGVEPELALAVDALFPNALLMYDRFPHMRAANYPLDPARSR